jgi:hypothetical protein
LKERRIREFEIPQEHIGEDLKRGGKLLECGPRFMKPEILIKYWDLIESLTSLKWMPDRRRHVISDVFLGR